MAYMRKKCECPWYCSRFTAHKSHECLNEAVHFNRIQCPQCGFHQIYEVCKYCAANYKSWMKDGTAVGCLNKDCGRMLSRNDVWTLYGGPL